MNFLMNLNLYKRYIPIDKLKTDVGISTDNKIINVESVEVSGSEVCIAWVSVEYVNVAGCVFVDCSDNNVK